jgi:hypothetical protein
LVYKNLKTNVFLNGRLRVDQPENGYRYAIDAVLLASRPRPKPGDTLIDLGTGCGIIALIVAHRYPEARIHAVDGEVCRAAEGPALEKRYPAKSGIVGSNPTLSATVLDQPCARASGLRRVAEGPVRGRDPVHPLRLHRRACLLIFSGVCLTCGEMSELAEGARLEIVCVVYSGTEGSNPSLSATIYLHLTRSFPPRIRFFRPIFLTLIARNPGTVGLPPNGRMGYTEAAKSAFEEL